MSTRGEEFYDKLNDLLKEYSDHMSYLKDGQLINWIVVAEYVNEDGAVDCSFQRGPGSPTSAIGMLISQADVLRHSVVDYANFVNEEQETQNGYVS